MKRIRIGNDIRVQTTLHELSDFDSTAVKQVLCYFVPKKGVDISELKTYDPAQYNICDCGKQTYNVFPCNIDAPHWFRGYNGFGINSMQFIHRKDKYIALARILQDQNKIEAYFPAKEQRFIGEYDVIFVVVLYQDGWNQDNLRTCTIDKGTVFALTSDNRDITTDTTIDLDAPYVVKIQAPEEFRAASPLIRAGDGDLEAEGVRYDIYLIYSDDSKLYMGEEAFKDYLEARVFIKSGNAVIDSKNGAINLDENDETEAYITYVYKEDPSIQAVVHITGYESDYDSDDE